ncbi:MAG: hypothetical protein LPK45_11435, partial [Bacteroidota bacterium]|nr:hypothetical protein [Bacteroidota bacterium]MDX5431719.1 hypothetical protein [Bacteroidota bacterium]MDX5470434.1 hypothetical protein [Bacteroidota bacterium]
AVRTRLYASLVSLYENGNRLPTRDHILSFSQALMLEQSGLLVAWLKEKLLKTLSDEPEETIRNRALAELSGNENASRIESMGSIISQKQEEKILELLTTLQQEKVLDRSAWDEKIEKRFIGLSIRLLEKEKWSWQDAESVLLKGQTIPNHSFQSHLSLHRLHELLTNLKNVPKESEPLLKILQKEIPAIGSQSLRFDVPFSLFQLAKKWESLHEAQLNFQEEFLVLSFQLAVHGFPPLLPPTKRWKGENTSDLAEEIGDWLIGACRSFLND